MGEQLTVIAGLGNPGGKYENTRHNLGFAVIDHLSRKTGIKIDRLRHKALFGEGFIGGKKVMLAKPQTFMNSSGECLREIVDWYKVPLENVVVIYDDADLPPGTIRIRSKGSSGTHNGMKSVIYQLQSDEFPRIRIGIGKAPEGWDLADYVLGRFEEGEADIMCKSVELAAEAAIAIVESGVGAAMSLYNGAKISPACDEL